MLRNLSDTARLSAAYRAFETDRDDPLFRDPFAHRLAGPLGHQMADALSTATRHAWVIAVRTLLFDRLILGAIDRGIDTVVNLAAGFDTRPYRLALPSSLRWIEVDLPHILAEKDALLEGERPVCDVRRRPCDLSDAHERRALLASACGGSADVLVLTEGLLIYLGSDAVAALSSDVAATPSIRYWLIDLQSPGLLRLLQRATVGRQFGEDGAPLTFAPADGAGFFSRQGWHPFEVCSITEEAARARRLPSWSPLKTNRPITIDGLVCLLARS